MFRHFQVTTSVSRKKESNIIYSCCLRCAASRFEFMGQVDTPEHCSSQSSSILHSEPLLPLSKRYYKDFLCGFLIFPSYIYAKHNIRNFRRILCMAGKLSSLVSGQDSSSHSQYVSWVSLLLHLSTTTLLVPGGSNGNE